MVLNFPDSGVVIEGSAKDVAELPAQAFAITLSDSVIEDMILCVQNGGDIQLALGSNPVSNCHGVLWSSTLLPLHLPDIVRCSTTAINPPSLNPTNAPPSPQPPAFRFRRSSNLHNYRNFSLTTMRFASQRRPTLRATTCC